jgi:arsenate reductase (glutaredoxin)
MSVTIYHNPDCGTSRNTLAMIRQSGVDPTVIEYLKTPPSREKLVELIDHMLAHPILINRPIVATPKGAKLCRPSEAVLELLPLRISADSSRKTVRSLRPDKAGYS